ncbi:uncharacterized protein [Elaeis guineensis]|uniref:uncharacterized protein n=1 Tax=Elaeis guineensis var. tenera TaxID=51953 RepID=UPI003C6DA140
MLLRSSSTPILRSLLSSSPFFFESPNNKSCHQHNLERTSSSSSSFPHAISHHPNPSLHCCFSPISDSSDCDASSLGFRRALSEGNLKSLLPDDSHRHHPPIKSSSSGRRANRVLKTIPSFSIYSSKEEEEEESQEEEEEGGGGLKRSVTIGETITGEFGSSCENQKVGLGDNSWDGNALPPLFLARGPGIDRLGSGILDAGSGSGGSGKCTVLTGNGGEQSDMETYYKKMVDENPGNALFLRNYAQFLYQAKGDPQRAEEYYSRAILADPGDGGILSQYAKLVWELHHDEERASSYFEKAVQATPHDSHVLAAYAGFLWETEDDDGVEGGHSQDYAGASVHLGPLASTAASS